MNDTSKFFPEEKRKFRGKPLEYRLLKRTIPVTESGCLLWTGTTSQFGYGLIWNKGHMVNAHRISYSLFVGPIPHDLHVLHKCDVPGCINPNHLFLGTNADNVADKMRKGRYKNLYGEKCPNNKLKEYEVIEIRRSTGSLVKLGKKFNISPSQIANIKHRRLWRWLKDDGNDLYKEGKQ